MKKLSGIFIALFCVFFLTGCGNKEKVNTETNITAPVVDDKANEVEEKEETQDKVEEAPTKTPEETPTTTPTEACTPKKFTKNYKYFYATKEECTKESQSTAFFDITDNVDSRVFTVNCDEIVDDCGTTWYGVSYNIYDPENSTRDDGVVVVYY